MAHVSVQPGKRAPFATDHQMRLVAREIAQGGWPPIGTLGLWLQRFRIWKIHVQSKGDVAIHRQHHRGARHLMTEIRRIDPKSTADPRDHRVVIDWRLSLEKQCCADHSVSVGRVLRLSTHIGPCFSPGVWFYMSTPEKWKAFVMVPVSIRRSRGTNPPVALRQSQDCGPAPGTRELPRRPGTPGPTTTGLACWAKRPPQSFKDSPRR